MCAARRSARKEGIVTVRAAWVFGVSFAAVANDYGKLETYLGSSIGDDRRSGHTRRAESQQLPNEVPRGPLLFSEPVDVLGDRHG